MERAEIYLVPGFLGFRSLESLEYFRGVPELLAAMLRSRGIDARVEVVLPPPAGHVAKRAQVLAETIATRHDESVPAIHLVGHSTGGLDQRLLLSPTPAAGFALPTIDGVPFHATPYAAKVRSVTSLATPHFGTPIAPFLEHLGLPVVLRLLGYLADRDRDTKHGLAWGAHLVAAVLEAFDEVPIPTPWLDYFRDRVILPFAEDPEDPAIHAYLEALGRDSGTLADLSQEACARFAAGVEDAPGVRYASVATCAPRGRVLRPMPAAVWASTQIFHLFHFVTGRREKAHPYAPARPEVENRFREDLGMVPTDRDNDGLVPTRSQVHGELLGAYLSDHLDVVGMFPHYEGSHRFVGWIDSGSSFRTPELRDLYGRIADVMTESQRAQPAAATKRAPAKTYRPKSRRGSKRPPVA